MRYYLQGLTWKSLENIALNLKKQTPKYIVNDLIDTEGQNRQIYRDQSSSYLGLMKSSREGGDGVLMRVSSDS